MIGAHGAIFVWFIRRALPESPRWLAQNGRLAEADQVMSKLELIVEREYGRPLPAPDAPELVTTGHAFRDVWVKPYGKRATMMIVFNIFQTVGFYGFAKWVPTLLIKQGIPSQPVCCIHRSSLLQRRLGRSLACLSATGLSVRR